MPGQDAIPRFLGREGHALAIAQAQLLTPDDWHNTTYANLKRWGLLPDSKTADIASELKTDEAKADLEMLRDKYQGVSGDRRPSLRVPFVLGHTLTPEQLAEARREYLPRLQERLAA
jgi:hypothetical protein